MISHRVGEIMKLTKEEIILEEKNIESGLLFPTIKRGSLCYISKIIKINRYKIL